MKNIICACIIVITLSVSNLNAQNFRRGFYGGYGGFNRASTVGESYARGMADLIRSQGLRNLFNSEALINYEEARTKYLENRIKNTETYFQMRSINKEVRKATDFRNAPTAEEWARMTKELKPKQLSIDDFDPRNSHIKWPIVFRSSLFKADTKKIEKLLAKKPNKDDMDYDDYSKLLSHCNNLKTTLKSQVKKVPANDYIDAKNFIKSLLSEING
jgi:hypothetical protein